MGNLLKFGNGHGRMSVSSELNELELTRKKCMCLEAEGILSRGKAICKGPETREYLIVLYSFFHFEFSNNI